MYEKTNTGAIKKYYTAFGRTIAIRDLPTGSGAGIPYYPVPDHLGSTSTILDANGSIISSQRYWPYGATRSGAVTQTDRLYTGQRQEPIGSTLGLYNYNARFYSTTLGRFVSADPFNPSTFSQSLNRYSYVLANPLTFTDTSGFDPDCPQWGTPCPEKLPSPLAPGRHGTPVPGVDQGSWDTCLDNPASCLMWAAGGSWETYIGLASEKFSIPADILSAIILNEMDSHDWRDTLKEGLAERAGIECVPILGCASYGIAQIQLLQARQLETKGLVPLASGPDERIARLKDPGWAIYYAAAYLSDARDVAIRDAGRLGTDFSNDLIILYFASRRAYQTWVANGAIPEGGETTGPQLKQVRNYLPDSVHQLAVRLSK